MDLNRVLIKGRPVVEPEVITFSDGPRLMVGVRIEYPRARLDVLPVIWRDPVQASLATPKKGWPLWIIGTWQRGVVDVSSPPRTGRRDRRANRRSRSRRPW